MRRKGSKPLFFMVRPTKESKGLQKFPKVKLTIRPDQAAKANRLKAAGKLSATLQAALDAEEE